MASLPFSPPDPLHPAAVEAWPWLDRQVLIPCRSSQVCLTCQHFHHHVPPNDIPLLTCHRHRGLIAHGEHLTHRCTSWMEVLHRRRGWAPDAA